MTSKIVVNNIEADSGVSSVTFNSNIQIGAGTTIHSSGIDLGSGNITSGIVTATTFDGALASSNLTGALPALDGSALTGVGASFGNSSVNTSGIITATAFVPTAQGSLSHRNIIINGDMRVAQRGTSSTSSGFHTIDRFNVQFGGTDEAMTVEQANVASGTTPYTLGFLKCLKVTNGNQTSGAGAGDWLEIYQYLEDQDICNSGWNFKSATSYLTISFWVKSSVSQKFAGFFYTNTAGQGDSYTYSYQIDNGSGGNLSADTWTKITHTIPGSSSLTFNNDNSKGLAVGIFPFDGTDYTTSGHTEETWQQWSSSNKLKDMDSTWWTTNNATFELTGLQLEVGSVATPFEHRLLSEELARCQRYFYMCADGTRGKAGTNRAPICTGAMYNASNFNGVVNFPVEMRTTPSLYKVVGSGYFRIWGNGGSDGCNDVVLEGSSPQCGIANIYDGLSQTSGSATWATTDNAACRLGFQAEV